MSRKPAEEQSNAELALQLGQDVGAIGALLQVTAGLTHAATVALLEAALEAAERLRRAPRAGDAQAACAEAGDAAHPSARYVAGQSVDDIADRLVSIGATGE